MWTTGLGTPPKFPGVYPGGRNFFCLYINYSLSQQCKNESTDSEVPGKGSCVHPCCPDLSGKDTITVVSILCLQIVLES